MKTFSIVLPCYNDLTLLQGALASILKQKDIDYEVIITDDSQDDSIEQYIQSLSHDDIHYYRHQQGVSASDNWNAGLQKASGKYVILMHHDEEMVQDDYLKRISLLMSKGADVVISQVNIVLNRQEKISALPMAEDICLQTSCLSVFDKCDWTMCLSHDTAGTSAGLQ